MVDVVQESHIFLPVFCFCIIYQHLGLLSVCVREVQKSLEQSAKRLIEKKLADFGLGVKHGFRVYKDRIKTPGDGVIIFQGLQDHTAESIKSLEGFGRAWIEEAQTLSRQSLTLLRPTIRAESSEIWASWNPRHENDPIDVLLRGPALPTGAIVVRANWNDNSFFPAKLEQERLDCLHKQPDLYAHIWEGDYISIAEGAYYAGCLAVARKEQRIGKVGADPLMSLRLFVDIGGTGARSDAFALWVCQFVGREIRVLDYYEAQGQPLATHVNWLRSKGYTPERAQIWLPHDGATQDRVYNVSYESALRQAGYVVTVIPNQGKGAAAARIEAVRRLFPMMWFNEATTEAGLKALGWYHEKRDEQRNYGLGPEHDWSSHAADAFGLMAVAYETPRATRVSSYKSTGVY
ncbi:Phage terminase large subunit [Liberibacter crescens BT-1]|uniref:Phage terminase large subunit n=2 Tax=Liberibacter crescens TaxID=1273132 RepID=L0EU85_LIBCB|nr:Phage terminase large subunit [Liberibacter crescens BT-1]